MEEIYHGEKHVHLNRIQINGAYDKCFTHNEKQTTNKCPCSFFQTFFDEYAVEKSAHM